MNDTDPFNVQEVLALTAVGESESLGEKGMQQTINSVMNRAAADVHWMGGGDVRAICLQPGQYDCWDPGKDRERIISIGLSNPSYGPYVVALGLAARALAGDLPDICNGGVSYYDSVACPEPYWAKDKPPCLVDGSRIFFDLASVM